LVDLNSSQISEIIESNDTEFCRHWAESPDVELTKEPFGFRLISDIAHPYFNSIFEANILPEQLSDSFDEALAPFRERKLPVSWWVGPKTRPFELGEFLRGQGGTHVACEAAMAMWPAEADYERASEGIKVQAVTSAADLRVWVEIMTGIYGLPEFTQQPWFRILRRAGLRSQSKLQHFLATVDGEVAGVGSIFYGSQAAGIYNIAVPDSYRGQGVASTLTLALLSLIDEQGYELATLCASQEAEALYRKIGFARYGELNCYVWPAE